MRMRNSLSVLASIWLLSLAGNTAAAPVYIVDSGTLVEIQNVEVDGNLYNVEFLDGTLENLFNLADPFPFDGVQASMASTALAVTLLDVADGDFDTQPTLTNGCAADQCIIYTPFVFEFGFVSTSWFRNAAFEGDDETGTADLAPDFDSMGQAATFASWTLVPVPPALILLVSGLAALGFSGRRGMPD